MSIYKPCDIRGNASTELTPELYRRWGKEIARKAGAGSKVVVGGDVRGSTPAFLAGLVSGLTDGRADVVNLGILPTPMVYYAGRRLQAAGSAIVTASHSPAAINGLKWMLGERSPTEDEVASFEAAAGKAVRRSKNATEPRDLDISFDYVAWLQELWADVPPVSRPIVIDPMHGCWSCRARRYLQAIFPHSFFSSIHDAPNGQFDGQDPDCSKAERLHDLSEEVDRQRAFLGIAFDGDGDRVAFVDDEGNMLTPDETAWVLLQSYADHWPGETFVCDRRYSDKVAATARQFGAEVAVERPGHTFIRNRMIAARAVFGAEISGHYFFRELGGGDDGLFAACRMIAFLAHSDAALSDLRRACPRFYVTPEIRVAGRAKEKKAAEKALRQTWPDAVQVHPGSVRVDFPKGWGLMRPSVTEAAITFRFEAEDWLALSDIVWRYCDALGELGNELWLQYHAAMGVAEEP